MGKSLVSRIIDLPSYQLLLLFFGFLILVNAIAIFFTRFTKTITVSEKYVNPNGRKSHYTFTDTQGETYRLVDSFLLFEFNSADDYANLHPGNTYTISGYWFRFPMMSWFPLVYKYTKK